MLNVLIVNSNYYQLAGLSELLWDALTDSQHDLFFLLSSCEQNNAEADIIFRDNMASINIFRNKPASPDGSEEWRSGEKITVHIPFGYKQDSLKNTLAKIEQILMIADLDYQAFVSKDVYKMIGLKQYSQLSMTENKIMCLIGKGYSNNAISKILNRSAKTINTHYRNASRKTGLANRAEFYKYASFIANCGKKERNTLCL